MRAGVGVRSRGYASTPPRCPLCGAEHYGVDHVWPTTMVEKPKKSSPGQPQRDSTAVGEATVLVVHAGSGSSRSGSSRHGKYADVEARKAYRREWMRQRRERASAR